MLPITKQVKLFFSKTGTRVLHPRSFFVVFLVLSGFFLYVQGQAFSPEKPLDFFLFGCALVGFLFMSGLLFHMIQSLVKDYNLNRKIINSIGLLDKPFFVTDLEGQVLFSNASLDHLFPSIAHEGIQALETHLADDVSRNKLKVLLQSPLTLQDVVVCPLHVRVGEREVQTFNLKLYPPKDEKTLVWRVDRNVYKSDDQTFGGNKFIQSLNLEKIFNGAPAGNLFLDNEGRIQGHNETFQESFLKEKKLDPGLHFKELLAENEQDGTLESIQRVFKGEKLTAPIDLHFRWGMEAVAYARRITYPIPGESNRSANGIFLQIFDNKEQRQIQLRLIQSQKIQAMGQLAGGIAHDFNNLLTAMIGFCDLLLMRYSPTDQSFTDIMQIKQNANRAANLVRQLLAFSRQQTLQPKMIDLSEALADLSILLQRLIGASIHLKIIHGKSLGWVKVDRGQIEQVIINLVVNARDAVEENGNITIRTSHVEVSSPVQLRNEVVQPGSYVLLEVSDDGKGIEKQNLNRIFDPFFSTKEIGSGTGLGLSTVYGIVKQTEGYIDVKSSRTQGTKFSIYIPRYEPQSAEALNSNQKSLVIQKDLTGSGNILLVEDERAVRLFSARALRDKGYHVIEASTGAEALEHIKLAEEENGESIDLIVTDVVMPVMDGPTLVNKAQEIFPDIKVIFISGYAEDAFRQKLNQDQKICFLSKPFSLKALAAKVKKVLETKAPKVLKAQTQAH